MRRLRFTGRDDVPAAAEGMASVIEAGGVALLPTETLYGLGASPWSQGAVERIRVMKGRPADLPLSVVCSGWEQVEGLVRVPERWRDRLRALWPGALTAIMECRVELPVSAAGTMGVRIPDHELLRLLLEGVGPLTATSANRHGAPPCSEVGAALESLVQAPDLILDGGATPGGRASTVVDLTGAEVAILRQGPVSWV